MFVFCLSLLLVLSVAYLCSVCIGVHYVCVLEMLFQFSSALFSVRRAITFFCLICGLFCVFMLSCFLVLRACCCRQMSFFPTCRERAVPLFASAATPAADRSSHGEAADVGQTVTRPLQPSEKRAASGSVACPHCRLPGHTPRTRVAAAMPLTRLPGGGPHTLAMVLSIDVKRVSAFLASWIKPLIS